MQVDKVAFFDVDETIINCKSMFDFQKYNLMKKNKNIGRAKFFLYWKFFKFLASIGISRETINLFYYKTYKGDKYSNLIASGDSWFNSRKNINDFFIKDSIDFLKKLKNEGYKIVFVSGSFKPCLEPIKKYFNADYILCAELEVNDDIVTGSLRQKSIGKYKESLVNNYILNNNLSKNECYAFGDHISDIGMLSSVGNPVVVKNCDKLLNIANLNGWKIINI